VWPRRRGVLLAQSEPRNKVAIAFGIATTEIVEQFAAAIDHSQQALTGVVVVRVGLEVFGKFFNTGGQQRA